MHITNRIRIWSVYKNKKEKYRMSWYAFGQLFAFIIVAFLNDNCKRVLYTQIIHADFRNHITVQEDIEKIRIMQNAVDTAHLNVPLKNVAKDECIWIVPGSFIFANASVIDFLKIC